MSRAKAWQEKMSRAKERAKAERARDSVKIDWFPKGAEVEWEDQKWNASSGEYIEVTERGIIVSVGIFTDDEAVYGIQKILKSGERGKRIYTLHHVEEGQFRLVQGGNE